MSTPVYEAPLVSRHAGYDAVRMICQVHVQGVQPARYGDPDGRSWLENSGPDGVRRPMLVAVELQRCQGCRGLVLDQDVNAHTAWHAKTEGRLERLEHRVSEHADWHGEQP